MKFSCGIAVLLRSLLLTLQIRSLDLLDNRRAFRLRAEKELDCHQHSPNCYSCIRYIEYGPLIIFIVNQNKIYHASQAKTIDQVAADSCSKQPERPQQQRIRNGCASDVVDHHYDSGDRDSNQRPLDVPVVKHSESDAGVLGVAQLEEAANDVDLIAFAKPH